MLKQLALFIDQFLVPIDNVVHFFAQKILLFDHYIYWFII